MSAASELETCRAIAERLLKELRVSRTEAYVAYLAAELANTRLRARGEALDAAARLDLSGCSQAEAERRIRLLLARGGGA